MSQPLIDHSPSPKYLHHSLPPIPYSSYNTQNSSSSISSSSHHFFTPVPSYPFQKGHLNQNDKIGEVNLKIGEVKTSLHQSIDSVIDRGEKLQILEEKAIDLEHKSISFYKNTRRLKCMFCKQNARLVGCGILALIILLIIIIVVSQLYK